MNWRCLLGRHRRIYRCHEPVLDMYVHYEPWGGKRLTWEQLEFIELTVGNIYTGECYCYRCDKKLDGRLQ